jgi:hypothetical protein
VIIAYEAHDVWPPGGLAVLYLDSHVEILSKKEEFDKQMAFTREQNAKQAK